MKNQTICYACSQIFVLASPSGQISFYKNYRMENECVGYLRNY